jgi:hypothetical protein
MQIVSFVQLYKFNTNNHARHYAARKEYIHTFTLRIIIKRRELIITIVKFICLEPLDIQRLACRLDDGRIGIQCLGGAKDFYLLHSVPTTFRAHPMGKRDNMA